MIITDYNKMTIKELKVINRVLGKEFVINNGRIDCVLNKKRTKEKCNE